MRFLLTFLFLSYFYSFAQHVSVNGRCTDKKGRGIEDVRVFVKSQKADSMLFTDENGLYHIPAFSGSQLKIYFYYQDFRDSLTYSVTDKRTQYLPDIRFQQFILDEIVVNKERYDPFKLPTTKIDAQMLPNSSIEHTLVLTTAASSNNELTTNYNVRGGNYDENLVYVNGFLINRPFLTRSGQQEGMSFINSALVESVSFSGGGFDAQYGDKMSSVLDITYRTPVRFRTTLMASMLGVEASVEDRPTTRFTYMAGARYRSNGYFLNTLPTKGNYNPIYWDAQLLTNYAITENITWTVLGHFSSNRYQFAPQSSKTQFGTASEAYSLNIYFDGQENTRFLTMTGGTGFKIKAGKKTNLDFFATVFNTDEEETYDIQGQYYINELESDASQSNYGDSIATLGVGTYLEHGRNRLKATVINIYHNGSTVLQDRLKPNDSLKYINQKLLWGVNYQHDHFNDVLSEWKMVDSAGYSMPATTGNNLDLNYVIKSKLQLTDYRLTGFVQLNTLWSTAKKNYIATAHKKIKKGEETIKIFMTDTITQSVARWSLSAGSRVGYTSVNQEFYVTPRASVTYSPRTYMIDDSVVKRRNLLYRFSTGLYYQPPFYRELRTLDGQLNLNVKAQKSFHAVLGSDFFFKMWGRDNPFKFTAEAYYKYMWDVNPYEIDNVKTRYYANNDAIAYAYGLDLNIHGEFVEGIESYFKVGILSTKENILNDSYEVYYNAAGEKITSSSSDQVAVDSATVYPGFIPRPTDQRLNFGALIQDQMPGFEALTVQLGIQFGTPLPYGPPGHDRYRDTLRMRSYFRVDIGTSYDLIKGSKKKNFLTKHFEMATISLEVLNLLGINNVLSVQWVQDVDGNYYGVYNYLTQRRFNLKMIVRI